MGPGKGYSRGARCPALWRARQGFREALRDGRGPCIWPPEAAGVCAVRLRPGRSGQGAASTSCGRLA